MSTFNESEHPRGQAANSGQFRDKPQSAPGVLVVDDWGEVNIREGSRTPWGEADNVESIAPGIVAAGTPSHGGVKLSPQRNKLIPAPLRNANGWYEEDCEINIPISVFPEEWVESQRARGFHGDDEDVRSTAVAGVKNWFPGEYERATGEKVDLTESSVLRDRAKKEDYANWRDAHKDDFVIEGYSSFSRDSTHPWVPDGYRLVHTVQASTGVEKWVLAAKADTVSSNGQTTNGQFVAGKQHLDVTSIVAAGDSIPRPESWRHSSADAPVLSGEQVSVSFDLTPAQERRAREELSKRWRFRNPDGTESVRSLLDNFRTRGVRGKRADHFSGESGLTYSVCNADGTVHNVSKATFGALTIPDLTTRHDRIGNEYGLADVAYEKLRRNESEMRWEGSEKRATYSRKVAAAKERLETAKTAREAASAEEKVESTKFFAALAEKTTAAWDAYQLEHGIEL